MSKIIKNWEDKDKASLHSLEAIIQNEYVSSMSIIQYFVITYRTVHEGYIIISL